MAEAMEAPLQSGPGRAVRQERSRKTYEALIAAGFRLLESEEFESLTIAGIAEEAGYSVGAFYARFESKDEFFEAMVAHHLEERSIDRARLFADASRETLVGVVVESLVRYYWRRRRFWRAVLLRSTNDPEFWAPINRNRVEFIEQFTSRIQRDIRRKLNPEETSNLRFAIQMLLGIINNRMINRPDPGLSARSAFILNLKRAFVLVADYDRLCADSD